MAPIKRLNADILTRIVKYIDIDSVETVSTCLLPDTPRKEIDSIINYRQNPMVFLKDLVDQPEVLLLAMGLTGVLLSGSRATEYFYPGIVSENSDWDFYCPANNMLVHHFESFLETMGVEWVSRVSADSTEASNAYYGLDITIGIVKCNDTIHTIQLIRDSIGRSRPFDIIVKFHSSIVQCFVSASGAVCMYKNLTMIGRSIAWESRVGNRIPEKDSEKSRQKYILRGIKYTSYEWYTNVDQNNEDHCISTKILDVRERRVGDDNCKVILFMHYYSRDIKRLKILHSENTCRMPTENLRWLEAPYRCIPYMDAQTLHIRNMLSPEIITKLLHIYPNLFGLLELQDVKTVFARDSIQMRDMAQALPTDIN